MGKIKTKYLGDVLEITNRLSKEERIHYEGLKLVNNGVVAGLLPVDVLSKGSAVILQTEVINGISLREYLSVRLENDHLLSILNGIIKIALECERNGLSVEHMVWSQNGIYIDASTGSLKMIFWPLLELSANPTAMLSLFAGVMQTEAWTGIDPEVAQRYSAYFYQRETMRLQDFHQVMLGISDLLQKRRSKKALQTARLQEEQARVTESVTMRSSRKRNSAAAVLESLESHAQVLITDAGVELGSNHPIIAALTAGKTVSRKHARITPGKHGDYYVITDEGSRNGTRVNGRLIQPGQRIRLEEGVIVRLGKCDFVFRSLKDGNTVVIFR